MNRSTPAQTSCAEPACQSRLGEEELRAVLQRIALPLQGADPAFQRRRVAFELGHVGVNRRNPVCDYVAHQSAPIFDADLMFRRPSCNPRALISGRYEESTHCTGGPHRLDGNGGSPAPSLSALSPSRSPATGSTARTSPRSATPCRPGPSGTGHDQGAQPNPNGYRRQRAADQQRHFLRLADRELVGPAAR